MPAPAAATYDAASKIAAHTAFVGLLDDDGTARIAIRNSADGLLATVVLGSPAGSVNGTTGQLTLALPATPPTATASGNAAYAEVTNGAGVVRLAMPCAQGTVAVPGYLVLNALNIVSGAPVQILTATIG